METTYEYDENRRWLSHITTENERGFIFQRQTRRSLRDEARSYQQESVECAAQSLAKWRLDRAFFGGWGYSVQDGMTDVPGIIVQQKRIIAEHSNVRIGLIDSTKVGKGSLDTFIPAKDLDVLITNRDVEQPFVESMRKLRTRLILA